MRSWDCNMPLQEFPLNKVTQIQAKWLDGLPRFILPVRRIIDLPNELAIPAGKLIVFIAADASGYDRLATGEFAKRLISHECIETVGWGPACNLVETDVDWAVVWDNALESMPERFILTSSFPDTSLEDAVEFFTRTYRLEPGPDVLLAIVEDREDWVERTVRAMVRFGTSIA